MRIRSVKPEFYRDAITGLMGCDLAMFYIALSGFADDAGRFEWSPHLIRADVDPFDAKWGGVGGITQQLDALITLGRVVKYEISGAYYGSIPSFNKHQSPQKPKARCPDPLTGAVPDLSETSKENEWSGSGSGEGIGEGSGINTDPWAKVEEVWSRVCVPAGFSRARKTEGQVNAARTRMKDPEWLGAFEAACGYAAANEFYRGGKDGSGWVATLGWFLKPGNSEKTAERAGTRVAHKANGYSAVGGVGDFSRKEANEF